MYWSIAIFCLCAGRFLENKSLGGLLKKIGDHSYDIYLMHTPYVVPVVARIIPKLTGDYMIQLLTSVCCGVILPLLASNQIRKISWLRKITLGIE